MGDVHSFNAVEVFLTKETTVAGEEKALAMNTMQMDLCECCPPMPKQLNLRLLGAPPSDPRRLRRKNETGGSSPDPGGLVARM